MVPRMHVPEGAGIPSPGSVTSLPQPPTPVPAPPETKCSGQGGRTHDFGEQKEGRRDKEVWMRAVEVVVQTREAAASWGSLGAGFWRSR